MFNDYGKDRNPRILIISQYFLPDCTGAATRTQNLIKGIVKKDWKIDLLTTVPHYPDGNKSSMDDISLFRLNRERGVRVIRFWMPPFSHNSKAGRLANYFWFTVMAAIGTLVFDKPDIVFTQSPNYFCWFPGLLAKIFRNTKFVANIDDLWPEALQDLGIIKSKWFIRILDRIRKSILQFADAIVCVSNSISRKLVRKGISHKKVKTIEVGFDFTRIPDGIQKKDGSERGPLRVVYSGILGPAYDFSLLVRLARLCSERGLKTEFIVKGRGPSKSELVREVKETGAENLSIIHSWYSQKEYVKFLSNTDVFILPMKDNFISKTALPTKLFEYMALSKPVLAIGRGEIGRLIEEASCGVAVNQSQLDSAVEFLSGISSGIRNPSVLGKAGRKFIENNLSTEKIGQKFISLFSELAGFQNRTERRIKT